MNRKKYIILVLLVIFSFGGFVYSSMNVFTAMKTIDQVMRLVRDYYVNPVKTEKLLDYAIEAIADSLDMHTTYLKKQDYENLMIETKGKFGGLGIRISKQGDYITIISPIEGTPAYNAGLIQGDEIIKIEGNSTKDMNLNKAVSIMRGKPGTKVTITISREGVDKPMDFTITRDIIKIKSVPYAVIVESDVGYIRINSFSQTTSKEVKNVLDSLINIGAKKFILDERSNPGGVLSQAVKTASLFIEEGKEIVYTEGKAVHESYNSESGIYQAYPLVVLVDGFSASGAEIVAGAIQDWDRGFLFGLRTFGKGSVQRIYPLYNEKALKLTIARYHTPSGRCIDKELVQDTTKEYHTRGPLHRKVKGGGGIAPDSTLNLEVSELYKKIFLHNIGFDFIVHYTAEHPDVESVTPYMLEEYKKKVSKEGIEFTQSQWDSASIDIKRDLKLRLAYNKGGIKGEYKERIPQDEYIQSAIEILKDIKEPRDIFKSR